MALAYTPPGVNVEELFSPTVNPLLASSAQIGVVGLAQGYQIGTTQAVFPSNATAAASLTTSLTGLNNDLTYTAKALGLGGNAITITYVVPVGAGAALSVAVVSNAITVNVATAGAGVASSTATQVAAAIVASGPADTLVAVANATGDTGAGVVTAMSVSNLTGGHVTDVVLTAPTGSVFQKVASNQAFVNVRDVLSMTAGVAGTGEYIEGADFAAVLSGDALTLTVTATAATDLANIGATTAITFRFVPEKYYTATRLDSLSAIEARYGRAFNPTGIETPLSAACSIAFQNGAQSLVVQPLYSTEARVQPTVPLNISAWQDTLIGLRDIEDVNILVPAFDASGMDNTAQLAVLTAFVNHIRYMRLQGEYVVLAAGEESVSAANLRTSAQSLASVGAEVAQHLVLVSPSRFGRTLPNAVGIIIGGQYVAAAIAGMIAARPVSTPITRKVVSGFTTIEDARDKAAKDADAASGLCVVETKGTALQVRHGLTTDTSDTARRELSVVRAKHRMIESIRDTVDTQIIGTVPADGNAPFVVKNAIIGVLELLRQRRELVDYTGVQGRSLTNDPSTVEVRFNYLPAFPLNYVNVIFSLDLSSGDTSTTIGS